jgi:hypothetical protein
VERVDGVGVRLTAPQGLGKKGLYTLTAGATSYLPPALSASTVSSGGDGRGGVVRHIPITDPQLLDEVYQGIVQAISDEVLGDHKWDEIMAYA